MKYLTIKVFYSKNNKFENILRNLENCEGLKNLKISISKMMIWLDSWGG